jgi:membrane protein DedA with SNARE-associated domain/rhodanese-related sulfurtransferase
MNDAAQFLIKHGPVILFAAVFVEQIGVPIPAVGLLLIAGSLTAVGKFSLGGGLALGVMACLLADVFWFQLGRYKGSRVLGILCRISLEPDSCVRRTQNMFARYGLRGVAVAKFFPGLSTLAPPLAGMSKVSLASFLLADGVGSLLYVGAFILLGRVFSSQIYQITDALASVGKSALLLLAALILGYLGLKYFQRQRILRSLRMARITVGELRQKQTSGEALVIIDVRQPGELRFDPTIIPGAWRVTVEELDKRVGEIPPDQEVVVYCSCPNEVSAARTALMLQSRGIKRVRPLLGGMDAWRQSEPRAGAVLTSPTGG